MTRRLPQTRSFLSYRLFPPPHLYHSSPSFPTPSLTLIVLKTLPHHLSHYFLLLLLTLSFPMLHSFPSFPT
jgi:hypothetical protein